MAKYPSYGIAKVPDHSDQESIKYFLYPRNLEKRNFLNYSIQYNDNSVALFLYYSNAQDEYGLRISEKECFQRLVDLFKSSDHFHNATINGTDSNVELIGEVLYLDKFLMKRWYSFYYYPYYSWFLWPYSLWW